MQRERSFEWGGEEEGSPRSWSRGQGRTLAKGRKKSLEKDRVREGEERRDKRERPSETEEEGWGKGKDLGEARNLINLTATL